LYLNATDPHFDATQYDGCETDKTRDMLLDPLEAAGSLAVAYISVMSVANGHLSLRYHGRPIEAEYAA
jgi:hypothetical protein